MIAVLEDGGFKRTPARSAKRWPSKPAGGHDKICVILNMMFHDRFIVDGGDVVR
jgi:hypothetical protein